MRKLLRNAVFLDRRRVPQNYPRWRVVVVVQKGGPCKSVKVVIKPGSEVKDREEFSRELALKSSQGSKWLFMLKKAMSAHKM